MFKKFPYLMSTSGLLTILMNRQLLQFHKSDLPCCSTQVPWWFSSASAHGRTSHKGQSHWLYSERSRCTPVRSQVGFGTPPGNSDHQDSEPFCRFGDPNLNLHLPPLVGGPHPSHRCQTLFMRRKSVISFTSPSPRRWSGENPSDLRRTRWAPSRSL